MAGFEYLSGSESESESECEFEREEKFQPIKLDIEAFLAKYSQYKFTSVYSDKLDVLGACEVRHKFQGYDVTTVSYGEDVHVFTVDEQKVAVIGLNWNLGNVAFAGLTTSTSAEREFSKTFLKEIGDHGSDLAMDHLEIIKPMITAMAMLIQLDEDELDEVTSLELPNINVRGDRRYRGNIPIDSNENTRKALLEKHSAELIDTASVEVKGVVFAYDSLDQLDRALLDGDFTPWWMKQAKYKCDLDLDMDNELVNFYRGEKLIKSVEWNRVGNWDPNSVELE